jgi:hypothetical protein
LNEHRPHPFAALAAMLLLGTACIPLPGARNYGQLVVAGKSGEDTLVADNGRTCQVNAETFTRVNVGDLHRCVWQASNSDGGGPTIIDPRRTGRTVPPTHVPPTPR